MTVIAGLIFSDRKKDAFMALKKPLMIVKQDEVARYLAEKLGLPEKLIRDPEEQQQIIQELQNMQQQSNMAQDELGIPSQQPQGQQ